MWRKKAWHKYNVTFVFQLPLWLRSGGATWILAWKERTAECSQTPLVGPVAVAIKSKPLRQVWTKGNCNLQLQELLTQGGSCCVWISPAREQLCFMLISLPGLCYTVALAFQEKSICRCRCHVSGQWFGGWALTFSRAPKFTSAPSWVQFKVKVSESTEWYVKATWQESTARRFTSVEKTCCHRD